MKKRMMLLFAMTMMMVPAASVSAEDLKMRLIGGEEAETVSQNLDDMQLEETYEIPGFVRVQPLSFEYRDSFEEYAVGMNGNNEYSRDDEGGQTYWGVQYLGGAVDTYYDYIYHEESGTNEEYACLQVDITNLQQEEAVFMDPENTQIKVVFDGEYEYEGWVRQFNYDYDTERNYKDEEEGAMIRAAIQPGSEEAVGKMYTGHYLFGCTLPNAVVNGQEPLYMVITINGYEMTYHIRK